MTYINAYKPSDGIVIPDDPPLGKKHALKKSDQFTLNTGCFLKMFFLTRLRASSCISE